MRTYFSRFTHLLPLKIYFLLTLLFLLLPFFPGIFSNYVAMLETDKASFSFLLSGFFFILFGIGIWTKRDLFHRFVTVDHGAFTSQIQKKIFAQITQELWNEYFKRQDLIVDIRLKKNCLKINGQAPINTYDANDLMAFLRYELLQKTGFFGKIILHQRPL